MRRRSGLMAVSVMRCSCLNGGCQSPIFRQDAAGLSPPANLSRSKARALEAQAVPGLAVFYRVSGFVLWHFPAIRAQSVFGPGRLARVVPFLTLKRHSTLCVLDEGPRRGD